MGKTLKKIELYMRTQVQELLDQCTAAQQDMFKRMYGSIETMDIKKMDWAIQQCERTISLNKIATKESGK